MPPWLLPPIRVQEYLCGVTVGLIHSASGAALLAQLDSFCRVPLWGFLATVFFLAGFSKAVSSPENNYREDTRTKSEIS